MSQANRNDALQILWRNGVLTFKLWPQQRPIYRTIRNLRTDVSTVVLLCARQFGKSFLGALLATEDCLQNPGVTVLIVGPTIKQTIDIVHQAMRKIMADSPEGLIRRSKSESRWYIGESELIVGGFDVTNATRQRGKTLYRIYVEEVVDSNPDQYLDSIRSDLGPALTHSIDGKIIYLTTPPKIPDHPFLTETVPEAKLSGSFFKYTIDDNTQLTTEQYESCVKRSGGKHTVEFLREYMCEIVRDTSLVVAPSYVQEKHYREIDLPIYYDTYMAIDWGGVRDMTVALVMTYDFITDTDMVLDEMVFFPNTPLSEIIPELRKLEAKYNPVKLRYVDAPGSLLVELNTTHKYQSLLPQKNDWQANVNRVNVRFSQDKLVIDNKCVLLRETLQSGMFNKHKTDFERTVSLGHCDAFAALMYGVSSMPRQNPWPKAGQDEKYFIKQTETAHTGKEIKSFVNRTGVKRFGGFK